MPVFCLDPEYYISALANPCIGEAATMSPPNPHSLKYYFTCFNFMGPRHAIPQWIALVVDFRDSA